MTAAYRRDHQGDVTGNDEWLMIDTTARGDITASINAFAALYPLPVASAGELRALQRAFARYLIDSGKASTSGVLND